jgi:hypothetical protein
MDSPGATPQPPPPASPWESVLAALSAFAPQPAAQFALPGENVPPSLLDPNALYGLLFPQWNPAARPFIEQRYYPELQGLPAPMPTAI